jgi:hypothetical protein
MALAAIVFANQVDGKYASGDFTGAESSAKWARILGWVAMGLVILGAIFNLIWFFVFGDSVIDTLF